MRLIDADALIEMLNDNGVPYNADANYFILNAPTIEAMDMVHGEWIINYAEGIKLTKCSACGVSFTTYDVYGWNYCPWCGARMKGADDEGYNI